MTQFTIGNNNTLGEIAQKLTKTEQTPIIKVRQLQPGEYSSGLVYVRKSNYRRNRQNPNLFDIYFQCVDGEGITFRCAMFSTDKNAQVRNEIMYITKIMAVEQIKTGIIYYNIENLIKFTDYKVPISTFLKEIPEITRYTDNLLGYVEELKSETNLLNIYNQLNTKYNYMEILKTIPYKDNLGTKLGSTLKIINNIIDVYKQINNIESADDVYEYKLFILIAITAFTQQALLMHNDITMTTDIREEFISEMLLPISEELIILIYKMNMRQIDRAKMLSVLNNMNLYNRGEKIKGKFPLEIIFFNILEMVEKNLAVDEIVESNKAENKKQTLDGIYIV